MLSCIHDSKMFQSLNISEIFSKEDEVFICFALLPYIYGFFVVFGCFCFLHFDKGVTLETTRNRKVYGVWGSLMQISFNIFLFGALWLK